MSKSDKKPMNNAGEIIDRFGGIRPMAAKIDTPVTTVQGWKKRDVIPGTRRDQILKAARANNIDISDIAQGASIANENIRTGETEVQKMEKKTPPPQKTVSQSRPPQKNKAQEDSDDFVQVYPPSSKSTPAHESLLAAIEENHRKTMAASAWIATCLILLAAAVAAFLLWPSVRENSDIMEAQSERLVELQGEVNDVNSRTSFMQDIVPETMQAKMDNLQTQARNIQNTVEQLSQQASSIGNGVLGADAGPLSQRLQVLEDKMAELSEGRNNFGDLITRIRSLEDSVTGQEQIKSSVDELRTIVDNIGDNQNALKQDLATAQGNEQGALGQTLEGVSGNDLKAAAMLIAFSQLRDSLNREVPFENDLVLLEKLAGNENPELQSALARLAPHADGGVLTAEGLSGEFKGFAGDIVVASLKGEDVSFKEKAKARLGNILQIEKEGEPITGTETQMKVAKAQKLLDEGNIQEAITELQTLEGPAAQAAQPFIQQAEVSLLAEKVQQLLGENILSKISGQLPGSSMIQGMAAEMPNPESVQTLDMYDVRKNLENAARNMDDQEVIHDEESGLTILPSQPGFKGFSGGQPR